MLIITVIHLKANRQSRGTDTYRPSFRWRYFTGFITHCAHAEAALQYSIMSIVMQDVVSMQSCYVDLRKLPLDDLEQVSRYHESSVEHNQQDKVSNERVDEER